jgi:tetratricopeptide (TPR) repeat protein
MGRDDWFRNTEWDEDIEAAFFAKLARAKDKSQRLRIQATLITRKYPVVALRLLDQYFSLGERWDLAAAHVVAATAYVAMGEVERAIASYEAALAREASFPNLKTAAYLEYPLLVAMNSVRPRYQQALEILDNNASRRTFPICHFLWHCAYALIQADLGNAVAAKDHAIAALEAAGRDHSGFRYHKNVGLVGEEYDGLKTQLRQLASA